MNNIEERIESLKASVALSDSIGPDELTVTVSDLSALIAQLEAAQKERDDLLNQEFQQRLANAEHQLYMKDLAIHNIKASRMAQFKKRLAAEAELSEANEKLSKPVVLPRMHVGFDGVSTNTGDSVRNKAISDCDEAIRLAGFMVDEGQDLWLT
ncbi:hypothetical protein [Yersinia rohdei]|uniref:hypothetical protein n=1 Tax=Yersinia rohdei TaxID=29485 RepID=UPI0025AAC509|nr:hypothetical protein [Yersinia rohdei]MDN0096227.1 hypothetical protein [Yersinia rohdei]